MQFVTSERGAQKLVLEGFVYVKQKVLKDGGVHWECELRHHRGCKAKLHVRGTDHLVARTNDHTHAPVTGLPDALKAYNSISPML